LKRFDLFFSPIFTDFFSRFRVVFLVLFLFSRFSSSPTTEPKTINQANVDGYSPIYTPDTWSESGDSYKLGTKGLVAWAGLIAVLLAVGANLVISTSQLGS
jgi:hypothetical protein